MPQRDTINISCCKASKDAPFPVWFQPQETAARQARHTPSASSAMRRAGPALDTNGVRTAAPAMEPQDSRSSSSTNSPALQDDDLDFYDRSNDSSSSLGLPN